MNVSRATKVTTLCLKNDTNVAYYNLNAHEPISIIFGRYVAETVRYRTISLLNNVSALTGETKTPKINISVML